MMLLGCVSFLTGPGVWPTQMSGEEELDFESLGFMSGCWDVQMLEKALDTV